ncbi:MAG: hypothetical protein ACNI26_10785 [Terasakiella sp.]|uniref:hypothetical protein n=1 Tax=unclassified Terasakiella TaxID=2614952 RepID=UPI003AFFB196
MAAKPRKWWFRDSEGVYFTEIRYGSSYLVELKAGHPSIECGKSKQSVIDQLLYVRSLIDEGELDDLLAAIKKKAQRREPA